MNLFDSFIEKYLVSVVWICAVFVIVSIIIGLVITLKNKGELNNAKIAVKSSCYKRVTLIPLILLFIILGGIIITNSIINYINDKEISILLIGMLFGLLLVILFLYYIINNIMVLIDIFKGDFVIVKDSLKSKEVLRMYKNEPHLAVHVLNFNDLYKKYQLQIITNYFNYRKAVLETKYYIVFCHNEKLIFSLDKYYLNSILEKKIINYKNLDLKKPDK